MHGTTVPKYLGRTYLDYDRDVVVFHIIPLNICIQFWRRAWYFLKTGISPDIVEKEIQTAYENGLLAGTEKMKYFMFRCTDLEFRMEHMKAMHQRELLIMKSQGFQEGMNAALREHVKQPAPIVVKVSKNVMEEILTEKDYEIVE